VNVDNQAYVITDAPAMANVNVTTYDDTSTVVNTPTGELTAYSAGGPVNGVFSSSLLDDVAGVIVLEPSARSVSYVQSNPVDPVYLEGEVAVGAGVPQTVTLYEIPDEEYRYANINGQTVLVETSNNAIVRVIR
jgi:hypothetical protein